MKQRKSIWLRAGIAAAVCLVLPTVVAMGLVYHGVLQLNSPPLRQYPIRGVDVSHYQGDIDWSRLEEQNIAFAYVKATEGSSHVDEKFWENWQNVRKTGIKAGAYHFFSFDSPAESQLENFTSQVVPFEGMLPPVVDFEFYGDKEVNRPDAKATTEQLRIMLDGLEAYYHVRPTIYATEDSWKAYLQEGFSDYPLWIRNVITKPSSHIPDWAFWQYSNRKTLAGYKGAERFIDMNVFCGNRRDWELWIRKTAEGWNYRPNWGTFSADPQYSYDNKYVAEQDVVDTEGIRSVRVTIRDTSTGETVGSFIADRALDFWGICWERDSYRIWTQSGDVGLRCYEPGEDGWQADPTAEQPDSVISKYDGYRLE